MSELAGAVKRRQEELRSTTITAKAALEPPKPPAARDFGPSAAELQSMRAGLRKCSNPATFSPKASPAEQRAIAQPVSPEWSPTMFAVPPLGAQAPAAAPAVTGSAVANLAVAAQQVPAAPEATVATGAGAAAASIPAAPVTQHSVLQNVTPQPATEGTSTQPEQQHEQPAAGDASAAAAHEARVAAEVLAPQSSSPGPVGDKTVPLDDFMQQLTAQHTQQLQQQASAGDQLMADASEAGTVDASPIATPPPMFDAPAEFTVHQQAAATETTKQQQTAIATADVVQQYADVEMQQAPTPQQAVLLPASDAAASLSGASAQVAGVTREQSAPMQPSPEPQLPALAPGASMQATPSQPLGALPLTPLAGSAKTATPPATHASALSKAASLPQASAQAPGSSAARQSAPASELSFARDSLPAPTPTAQQHAASAPVLAGGMSGSKISPLQRVTPAAARSSSAPARSPHSATPEATRRELTHLRSENRQLRDALAALRQLHPEFDDAELLERPITFVNKLRELRNAQASAAPPTKLRIKRAGAAAPQAGSRPFQEVQHATPAVPQAGLGMGEGVMQAAQSAATTPGSVSFSGVGTAGSKAAATGHPGATSLQAGTTVMTAGNTTVRRAV